MALVKRAGVLMPLAGPLQDPVTQAVWLLVIPKGSLLRTDVEWNLV